MTPATPPYADTNSFKLCSVASTASCSLTGAFSDFSVEAARAGMARSYVNDYKPVSRYPEIRAAEEDARGAHRGLWARPVTATPNPRQPDPDRTSPETTDHTEQLSRFRQRL
jgi:endonuclease YncB( thermonuclease family)